MSKNKKILIEALGLLIVVLVIISLYNPIKGQGLELGNFNVGLKISTFDYLLKDGTSKTLRVAIWYPTIDTPKDYMYAPRSSQRPLLGQVALNGEIDKTGAPYPLFLFSHGGGGGGFQTVWLTQYIASHGYIVMAPDHIDAGEYNLIDGKGTIQELLAITNIKDPYNDFPNRPEDIKACIDEMLQLNNDGGSPFYQTVAGGAIGVSGHSYGGWTTQVLCGAVDVGYEHVPDNRITACLPFEANTDWIKNDEYPKIDVPIMYLIGEYDPVSWSDGITPRRKGYDHANLPKFLPIIKQFDHLDGTNDLRSEKLEDTSDSSARSIWVHLRDPGYNTVEECWQDARANTVLKYSLAFLNRYLKNDFRAEDILTTADAGLVTPYEYDVGLPNIVLEKSANKTVVNRNEEITYTITYKNTGLATGQNIIITDNIPEHTSYVQGSATGGGLYDGTKIT